MKKTIVSILIVSTVSFCACGIIGLITEESALEPTAAAPVEVKATVQTRENTPTPVLTITYTPLPASTATDEPTSIPSPLPTSTPLPALTPEPVESDVVLRFDPDGPDRDCGDFSTHQEAQMFYEAAGGPATDRHRLDKDKDGLACEDD